VAKMTNLEKKCDQRNRILQILQDLFSRSIVKNCLSFVGFPSLS
jgi:hypothetical protein